MRPRCRSRPSRGACQVPPRSRKQSRRRISGRNNDMRATHRRLRRHGFRAGVCSRKLARRVLIAADDADRAELPLGRHRPQMPGGRDRCRRRSTPSRRLARAARSETALQAAVRTSVAARASSVASGRPVLHSKAVSEPCRRSSPRGRVCGRTLITLTLSRSSSVSAPEMRKIPAPSPRSMCDRTGATAAPRETMASAAAIASAT